MERVELIDSHISLILIATYHTLGTPMALGTVKEIMTRDLVTVSPSTSVRDAAKKMFERKVGSVLVVGDDGKLLGIFTERDLVKVVAEGKPLDAPVSEVMSRDLIVAKEGDSIASVANRMLEKWIRHMPVIDDSGRPIGIVSIRDVLRYIAASGSFP